MHQYYLFTRISNMWEFWPIGTSPVLLLSEFQRTGISNIPEFQTYWNYKKFQFISISMYWNCQYIGNIRILMCWNSVTSEFLTYLDFNVLECKSIRIYTYQKFTQNEISNMLVLLDFQCIDICNILAFLAHHNSWHTGFIRILTSEFPV